MRRWTKARMLMAAVALAAPVMIVTAGPGRASGGHQGDEAAPRAVTVHITGKEIFRPNYFAQTYAYPEDATVVASGGTVTWRNDTTDAHSISLVAAADVPTNVDNCPDCDALFRAHNLGGPSGPPSGPPVLYIDGGMPQDNDGDAVADSDTLPDFDTVTSAGTQAVGDSQLIDAKLGSPHSHGFPDTVTVRVTAPKGSTLHYICIFHTDMQGEIVVR